MNFTTGIKASRVASRQLLGALDKSKSQQRQPSKKTLFGKENLKSKRAVSKPTRENWEGKNKKKPGKGNAKLINKNGILSTVPCNATELTDIEDHKDVSEYDNSHFGNQDSKTQVEERNPIQEKTKSDKPNL